MSSSSRLRRQRAAANVSAVPVRRAAPRAEPSFRQRARYAFDTSMSRGPAALLAYLGLAVLALVLLAALAALLLGLGPTGNPITAAYNALLHTIDSGTVAGDVGTGYTLVGLGVTFGGIVIFSAFIGVLATSLDERLVELRKGRSFVLERDHTLILGWSDTIFTILRELAVANESEADPVVVVLAERDKVEMEDAIRERVGDLRGTRVVCRTGSPIDLRDLAIVNHQDCRSIIVLSPDEEDPDASVIKTVLALVQGPQRREAPYRIVAEIEDVQNLEAAYMVGGEEAIIVDKGETIARLIVQSSRQSGAAAVYRELMDFDGDELYFRRDPALEGRTYGDVLLAYEDCSIIGLRDAGGVHLNPPAGTVVAAGAEVIAVAEDDSVLDVARPVSAEVEGARIVSRAREQEGPRRALVIGVNQRTAAVLRELDDFLAPGSHITVMAGVRARAEAVATRTGPLRHTELELRNGSSTDRGTLEALDVTSYDNVIVMSDDDLSAQRSDARTLVTLLHLRDITAQAGVHVTIASEMLDEGNRTLAQVARADDVIVSDEIVSLMLAQISENEHLFDVFDELLSADGSEVYLRDVTTYVSPGPEVSYATLVASARERGETAIGYRVAARATDAGADFGVVVNPPKSERFACEPGDRLIVLAED